MNENQAEIKAQAVETEMKKYFGSLVSDFNLIDAFYGNGHEEFSLGFKYCDYLKEFYINPNTETNVV
mgnify:CR=1 FL=1